MRSCRGGGGEAEGGEVRRSGRGTGRGGGGRAIPAPVLWRGSMLLICNSVGLWVAMQA